MQAPVRAGQCWRNPHAGGSAAQIISVDAVEGTTVEGTYTQEDAPVTGAGAWSVQDFTKFTLVHDPEWAAHRVVMAAEYADPKVDEAMQPVGEKGGAQSMTLSESGKARAWWDVVAPTEADAVRRAREAVQHLAPEGLDLESIHVSNNVPDRG
jgi:hypothetical protein